MVTCFNELIRCKTHLHHSGAFMLLKVQPEDLKLLDILYSGKFWQEKILANLASMHGFAKILFAIFINTESAVDAVHR